MSEIKCHQGHVRATSFPLGEAEGQHTEAIRVESTEIGLQLPVLNLKASFFSTVRFLLSNKHTAASGVYFSLIRVRSPRGSASLTVGPALTVASSGTFLSRQVAEVKGAEPHHPHTSRGRSPALQYWSKPVAWSTPCPWGGQQAPPSVAIGSAQGSRHSAASEDGYDWQL